MNIAGREILLYLSLKYEGDWDKMYDAIKKKEDIDFDLADELIAAQEREYVTIVDANYPESFRYASKPPLVIYYRGNLELLKEESHNLAYIGSRNASEYGKKMAREICSHLAKKKINIISGMARGIDSEALRAAIEAGGKAVAILGSGIDNPYPSSSRDIYDRLLIDGLVISEYPGKLEARRANFPMRNRLISAVSKAIVVGEAGPRSGSLNTVGYAAGFNKDIGCVPFEAGNFSACNRLIKDGAALIENGEDALALLE